ncbi:MAG: hypothetical protein BWY19_01123 [bacterium ADurb.Bin212]|nr:MAG: hypothetical protein BWY19_01123 [bacterium ADurb.Bin212]
MGPTLIFDKSFLQSLSIDESCWLDNFYLSNITPLFYIETLADLSKTSKDSKKSEDVVSLLAHKTPSMGAYPNLHHRTILLQDLIGNHTPMDGRTVVSGGQTRISRDGKVGQYYDEFPESEALNRWQNNEFSTIESEFAKRWRIALSTLDFDQKIGLIKNIVPAGKTFKSLEEIKSFIDIFIKEINEYMLDLLLEVLDIPTIYSNGIKQLWISKGRPSLSEFAPYATFVFKVDLFFYLSVHYNLISKDRPSNKIDFAYLYYLPFCNVFVSNDKKTHHKVAKMFMEHGQSYIAGDDLKADLKKIDEYYDKLPEETKIKGIMSFAIYPPEGLEGITTKLWDKYLPIWRKQREEKKIVKTRDTKQDKKIIDEINNREKESTPVSSEKSHLENADYVIFKRSIIPRKGKWRIVSPEVENKHR